MLERDGNGILQVKADEVDAALMLMQSADLYLINRVKTDQEEAVRQLLRPVHW